MEPPKLMPHQEAGIEWLLRMRKGLFAWEPGTGKTLAALEAVRRDGARRVLVVAPAPLLGVWRDEAAKWYGWPVTVLRGSPASRKKEWDRLKAGNLGAAGTEIVALGYETLRIDYDFLKGLAWDAIILDETLKIQNARAKVTKKVMALKSPLKLALNGTPVSNSWADLWPVMTWLEPFSLYGNFYKFRSIHAVMSPHFPAVVGWRGTDVIKARIAPLMDVKRKADVLKDLPEKVEQVVTFELEAAELAAYRRIQKELQMEIGGQDVAVTNALVKLLRLRQAANGLFAFDAKVKTSSKLDALKEILDGLPPGAQALVFTSFKDTADAVEAMLGKDCRAITGATSAEEREARVADFKSGAARFLVGTDAIAYGLNLQEASYVVNVDLPFSYAKYEQRIGRAWRNGQKNAVTVYNLEAAGTVDAHVRKILERKLATADEATGGVTREDLQAIINT